MTPPHAQPPIYYSIIIIYMFENAQPIENAYFGIRDVLPSSALGYHTNNRYEGFPPLMSDGRSVQASWQPEAAQNKAIIQQNGIRSNWQYRQYLTHHAKEIMRADMTESANDVGYYQRYLDIDPNDRTLAGQPQPQNAIRTPGYIDRSSDLKNAYLSREQLEARMISPAITQAELLRYTGGASR